MAPLPSPLHAIAVRYTMLMHTGTKYCEVQNGTYIIIQKMLLFSEEIFFSSHILTLRNFISPRNFEKENSLL